MLLFSVLWCLGEYLRSFFLTGFPWLLVGTTQMDTPLKYLAPLIGTYGLSLLCCLAATLLVFVFRAPFKKRLGYLLPFLILLTAPTTLKHWQWTETQGNSLTLGAIQANLSMRDKWDDALFWTLLDYYEKTTATLYGKQVIILPESAIPLPARYLTDYLERLNQQALKANSSILLGILQPTSEDEDYFNNALITLGHASGQHVKRHLVPFGEYIPRPLVRLNRWLGLPELNLLPGPKKQRLIRIFDHPIASLICYEIAYPHLLREQMPKAQWIVSISDNGWFGHSLASYQQLQMAQTLSLMTGRYQVVVNNDGLSSVINSTGDVLDGLPAFSSGVLESEILPVTGSTPWILWGEYPVVFFCSFYLFYALLLRRNLNRAQVPVADLLKSEYP
jgi:apolipoprotein N-acyltransferase